MELKTVGSVIEKFSSSRAALIGPIVHTGPISALDPQGYRCIILMDNEERAGLVACLVNLKTSDKDEAIEGVWKIESVLSEVTKVYVAKSPMHFGKTALKYWPSVKKHKEKVKELHDKIFTWAFYRSFKEVAERPQNALLQ